ncbi:Protein NRT1/ PTR FAMILY 5.6 [Camellia lanceoleosa]|uniref:Protein NRT1/ PTR FAMILY 5.6 n=1 Tax=Camellia lanceoleosa TaxID=1840588 RepID=A0ACC0G6E7_9ERIC|nr:Protein NRT1/ PTR FAMILY 5.6 [Camellia lanceoleosa]
MARVACRGLVFGHSVVEHAAVVVLMTYLMAEWKEDLQKSAAAVNINQGLTSVITLAFAHLADTYVGCFKMVFFSTISYVIGLSLLCLSILKLFPHTKVCLFYIALAMIAMGRAGRNSTLKPFLAYQFRAKYQEDDDDRVQSRTKVCWSFAWLMGKTKVDGEEALRKSVVALNGLAGIAIINQDFSQAASLYREALVLAEEHSEDFRLDPLLNIHIHYNLAEIRPLGYMMLKNVINMMGKEKK